MLTSCTDAIVLTVNGDDHMLVVEPNELLINVLRNELGLTGAKYGCGTGQCGACTVLIDGEPVLSCITLAIACDGKEITTIEGITGPDGGLHPIQEEFLNENAVQCGFCTPGMILIAGDLLQRNPHPTEDEIRHHIKGNICRCTGYNGIVRAIQNAAARLPDNDVTRPVEHDEVSA
jgi:Aerobic-type carbon monoxide dehydrogenase, small subunit CoxS/CutS homologs